MSLESWVSRLTNLKPAQRQPTTRASHQIYIPLTTKVTQSLLHQKDNVEIFELQHFR